MKVGDVVSLPSNLSLLMTVEEIPATGNIKCVWYDEKMASYVRETFREEVLVLRKDLT